MKFIHIRSLTLAILPCLFLGCSAREIKSGTITETKTSPEVAPIEKRTTAGEESSASSTKDLASLNTKAGKPTFGIIKGFYQLPEAAPYGAISLESVRSFGFDYQSVRVSGSGTKPYAVVPAAASEAEAMSSAMNQLMDAGVRFVEVSLADATKIMQAERKAVENKSMMFPKTSIPSGVDVLLSLERGEGSYGPIYVGRVIRTKDGQLFALATEPDVGTYALSPLITRLVKDSLGRIASQR